VEIDVGLDAAGLGYDDEAQIAVDAARLGYGRIWIASIGDPFQACVLRWAPTRAVLPGGIGTAIGVLPIGPQTPASMALSAAALSRLTEGRFILGIGSGAVHEPEYRRTWGIEERSSLALVRAYLETLRGFLAGQPVTYHGSGLSYDGARLPGGPARTPVYLGAGGPEMSRLGGELAEGVYLSWCTPGTVTSTRERMAEGAARADRDPADVALAASVRVCIDDDGQAARRALAHALLPYVLGSGGAPPAYARANFERMGFAAEVAELYRMNEQGLPRRDIAGAFPERMLRGLGYFGPAAGAAEAVRQQVAGADVAVVRIVPSRPGLEPIRAILDACLPARG
jgi:alkanesulfonate monooxygenase SsuD/methylene tetrahydromethanopterin reductase-like flavin-dependent oxidoreductase (luciferase family)